MKPYILLFGLILVFVSCTSNQDSIKSQNIDALISDLQNAASIANPATKEARINAIWDSLEVNNLIPVTEDSTVLFLYRGEAESVSWNGDFNSWSNDKRFENEGSYIKGSNIWFLKQNFPSDARLDYKITLNNDNWILDPVNQNQQWSGFGPNSELRMPDWKEEPLTKPIEEASKGTLSAHKFIDSKNLEYKIQYRVYIPAGYEKFENLSVLYTTDGQEYSDDKLGAGTIVLDNLIHLQLIKPIIAVFVEPLNPDKPNENRRMDEMGMSEKFLSFFVDELIPEIESNYKVNAKKENRVILGTSLGGLNSAYFGFTRPDMFDGVAIQAPAFWYREEIYDLVRNAEKHPSQIYMTVGTIGDNTDDARLMKRLFEQEDIDFSYLEVNEGHSWGAWRAQMDDILVHFFGNRSE
tara:strand:+ start:32352 stop:33578 length:1227 start_codon:yes stop_codon:yes gene_type:complete